MSRTKCEPAAALMPKKHDRGLPGCQIVSMEEYDSFQKDMPPVVACGHISARSSNLSLGRERKLVSTGCTVSKGKPTEQAVSTGTAVATRRAVLKAKAFQQDRPFKRERPYKPNRPFNRERPHQQDRPFHTERPHKSDGPFHRERPHQQDKTFQMETGQAVSECKALPMENDLPMGQR